MNSINSQLGLNTNFSNAEGYSEEQATAICKKRCAQQVGGSAESIICFQNCYQKAILNKELIFTANVSSLSSSIGLDKSRKGKADILKDKNLVGGKSESIKFDPKASDKFITRGTAISEDYLTDSNSNKGSFFSENKNIIIGVGALVLIGVVYYFKIKK